MKIRFSDVFFGGICAFAALTGILSGYTFLTILFGGILLSVVLFKLLYGSQNHSAVAAASSESGDNNRFWIKKYFPVDFQRFGLVFSLLGLAISIATITSAFNYQTPPPEVADLGDLIIEDDIEIAPPPTEQKPPPPEIEVVEDDEVLEEEPEILDTEADEETEIEIVEEIVEDIDEEVEEAVEIVEEAAEEEIFTIVEQNPEFPGGTVEMMKFINSNIKYPPIAKENNIEGRAVIGFVVEKDGSISNIQIKRDIGGGCGAEAVRVVKMMPKWNAGKQRGKPVRVSFNLPVRFKLE